MEIHLDPLDPLTEVVRSGQAFSSFIIIERLIWLLIGAFFIGAMSTGLKNGMKDQDWFANKSFLMDIKKEKKEDDKTQKNNQK